MNILITTSSFSVNKFPSELTIINNPYKRRLNKEEVKDLIIKYQPIGIIAGLEPLTSDVLIVAKRLKIISRCGIGLDSVDMEAAKQLGISVTNTPSAPVGSVAELTLGLMLSSLRRINLLDEGVRKGSWKGPNGNLLSDKVVGIIGCGKIGSYVAKLVHAFGCKVIGYDPYIKIHDTCSMTDFHSLLKDSDIISLHVPYSEENRYFISKSEFKMMKSSVIIINTARGGLIDEVDLYEALKNEDIAHAAIDCFETEPYNGPLINLKNTLLTPHMGSSASEARIMMEQQALDNLLYELKMTKMLSK